MLTFEQRASIIGDASQWTITEIERIEDMLQAAYDLGLKNAAAICDADGAYICSRKIRAKMEAKS